MKKAIYYSIITLVSILVASCKDDDGEKSASILGKWKGDRSEVKVTYGIIPLLDETDEEFDALLEFKDDGTMNYERDGTVNTGTYKLEGTRLTTNVNFQINGVELSDVTFDVVELTETKLRLSLDREQEVEVPDVGMVTTNVKGNFAFDRL